MRRWLVLLCMALLGLASGAVTTLATWSPTTTGTGTQATDPPPVEVEPAAPVAASGVLLVWTASGLPDGFASGVAELPRIEATTVVRGGRVDLVASHDALGKPVDELDDGWVVPLDGLAIDPETYTAFVPASERATVGDLGSGEALLGSTSADLRGLQSGDSVTLAGGQTLTIAGVVDDAVVGAAELVVHVEDAPELGLTTSRFLLASHRGDRPEMEAAIRKLADVEVRVRGPGETPFLRHGDAVLPQALVKDRFGEFAVRLGDGRELEQDPDWAADHVVTVDVPVLGQVRCHRGVVRQVRGALQDLEDRGLAHLVDPQAYAGCHHPRLIDEGGMLSRHAWGIALDLNADTNPTGLASAQDPRLVETFAQWGLTWGGFWLVPDPMHVEYVGPPPPPPGKVVGDAG